MSRTNERSYALTIEHPHPAKRPITVHMLGSLEDVTKHATEAVKGFARRWGLSPLAVSSSLEIVA